MNYQEFYNLFKYYFTGCQIATIQRIAFQEYKDAHGYYPMRKEQKQVAYGFVHDFMYNMLDPEECCEYLRSTGASKENIVAFWKSLDE